LTCKAFTVEAPTLTEVVEKWNRAKHSAAHSFSEIQIQSIEEIAVATNGSDLDRLASMCQMAINERKKK